jgi:chemotaxis protein histidine kinase CheA
MTHISSDESRAAVPPGAARDGFENLFDAFLIRLQAEREHLVKLSAELALTEENPQSIFADLQFRAHKLRGGAAIFEVPEVVEAAGAMEKAAVSASLSHAPHTDGRVWNALLDLVKVIGNR